MKVVITGIPQIGKTTMAKMIEHEFASEIIVRKDSLECLRNFLHLSPTSRNGTKCSLRAAYHLMVEMENLIHDTYDKKVILCDRGTIDCLNAWPEASSSFFSDLRTTLEAELNRYDWVIEIAGTAHLKKDWWQLHKQIITIPSDRGFSCCTSEVARAIKGILDGLPVDDICVSLAQRHGIAENYTELF